MCNIIISIVSELEFHGGGVRSETHASGSVMTNNNQMSTPARCMCKRSNSRGMCVSRERPQNLQAH
jgi:hypothetical protein